MRLAGLSHRAVLALMSRTGTRHGNNTHVSSTSALSRRNVEWQHHYSKITLLLIRSFYFRSFNQTFLLFKLNISLPPLYFNSKFRYKNCYSNKFDHINIFFLHFYELWVYFWIIKQSNLLQVVERTAPSSYATLFMTLKLPTRHYFDRIKLLYVFLIYMIKFDRLYFSKN